LNDLPQDIPKWVIRLLAFEMKVIAAITAGAGIFFVVTVFAASMAGLIFSLFELRHWPGWATVIIQMITIAIWILASLKVYRYLKQRSSTLQQSEMVRK